MVNKVIININKYVSNGTDENIFFINDERLGLSSPSPFTIQAIAYVPPVHIIEFPVSKRLVTPTPSAPKKLCTNGRVKQPILYAAK